MSQGCYFVNKKHAWTIFILCQVGKCLILLVSVSRLSFPPLAITLISRAYRLSKGEPKN